MGFFSEIRKAVSVDDRNTVYIRPLNCGEDQEVTSAAMTVTASKSNPDGNVDIDVNLMTRLTREICIIDWEGPDFLDDDGNPVPCTPDNVRRLPSYVADLVDKEISEINKGPSEAEKNE